MVGMGTVTVTFPGRRRVYVNGNYYPRYHQTLPCTVLVEYGKNTFETVDGGGRVDYSASVIINGANPHCELQLRAVVPPRPQVR